jgi:hypothetical protein
LKNERKIDTIGLTCKEFIKQVKQETKLRLSLKKGYIILKGAKEDEKWLFQQMD